MMEVDRYDRMILEVLQTDGRISNQDLEFAGRTMEYLIGGLLGAATALLAGALGFARDRSFFPTILIVIATYYVVFAAMGSSGLTV